MAKAAPRSIPVIRMGRLAIDRRYQSQGWGRELLREALLGAVSVMARVGGRAMLVDAISDQARRFYESFGFEPSPINPMQLMYDLRVVARSAGLET